MLSWQRYLQNNVSWLPARLFYLFCVNLFFSQLIASIAGSNNRYEYEVILADI